MSGLNTTGKTETGVNTALSIASLIPGPQQPFVIGANILAPLFEKGFGAASNAGPASGPGASPFSGGGNDLVSMLKRLTSSFGGGL